jgi:hypothetical protein
MNMRYVLVNKFCELTGYTDKAVRRKIEEGVWVEGIHYRRAPDGHLTIDIQNYYNWVEKCQNREPVLSRSAKIQSA